MLSRLGFFKKVGDFVGVDIGTTSIKLCAVKYDKDGLRLQKMASRSYEEPILSDGNIVDEAFLAGELKRLVSENGIVARDAACALSSYSVIAKRVSVPFLEEETLDSTMSLEVETVIPFSLKDIYYSYDVVGGDRERENMMNVQIVAAKKEIVDAYLRVFEGAGLNLQILDVDVFAVTNLVEQVYNPRDMSVVIVDIGASITNIAIMKEDNVEFTREVLVGGGQLTAQVMKATGLSFVEAESLKASGSEESATLLDSFVGTISLEINKTVNFYASTRPMERIEKVFLTGGSSHLPGLIEAVQGGAGIEVEVVRPFLLLNEEPNEEDPAMADYERIMAVALSLSSRVSDMGA